VSTQPAPGSARPSAGPFDLLWRALNSLPVAIFVMLALTLLSALGTLVPQEHLNPQPPGLSFAEFLTQRYGEEKFRVLHTLGFDHIYFTWYFNTLLTWLAVSAVICNIVRWRTTWRLWRTPTVRRGARFFLADKRSYIFSAGGAGTFVREGRQTGVSAPPLDAGRAGATPTVEASALGNATADEVATALEEDLRQLGYRVRREDDTRAEAGATTLYADKGFAKKWALVGLHVAILILLYGGFYGRAVGLNGDVRLRDGEQQTLTLDVTKGKYKWIQPVLQKLPKLSYGLHQHKFRIDWGRKLVLETELLKNTASAADLREYYWYYVNDYVSDLEVSHDWHGPLRKGRQTIRREVKVNHPLVINKLVVYQSGYEQHGYLLVSNGGQEKELRIPDALFGKETWYGLTADGIVLWHPERRRWFIPIDDGDEVRMQFVEPGAVGQLAFMVAENVKSGDLYKHHKKVGHIGPMAIFTLRPRDSMDPNAQGSLLLTNERSPQHSFDVQVGRQTYNVRLSPKVEDYSVFAYKRDPGSPVLFTGWLLLVAGIALTMYVPFTQVWVRAEPGSLSMLALGPERKRLKKRMDVMLGVEE
jgi:cytochrome c biogenesis protein ResB